MFDLEPNQFFLPNLANGNSLFCTILFFHQVEYEKTKGFKTKLTKKIRRLKEKLSV